MGNLRLSQPGFGHCPHLPPQIVGWVVFSAPAANPISFFDYH
jgi:hypothetical protein